MKNRNRLIAGGASALFAAALALQAQSTQTPPSTTPPPPLPPDSPAKTDPTDPEYGRAAQPSTPTDTPNLDRRSATPSSSGKNSTASDDNLRGSSSEYSAQNAGSLQADVTGTASARAETQVTTVVQQIDRQGAVVVDRAATQFSSVACTEANARQLIEALHSGNEVTLTSDKGESVTFKPTAPLGYGEAYLAMTLAVETLRQNGITGCATPEQWRSVLIGGPLAGATTTAAVSSSSASASAASSFPGILVLRQQGQGWGQIAQTTHVPLGTVVSSAQSSLNLRADANSRTGLSSSTGEMDQSKSATDTKAQSTDSTEKPKKKHWWQRDHSKDDKTNPDHKDSEPDKEEPNKS